MSARPITGTVTGQVVRDRHRAVVHAIVAVTAAVAAALGVFTLAVTDGLHISLFVPVGIMVVARIASAGVRYFAGDDTVGAYERRRCTFVVTSPSGDRTTCRLVGEPVGDDVPRRGETVEVYGRLRRDGDVRVREAVRIDDGTVVRARPSPATALAFLADVTAGLVALICGLDLVVSMIGGPS